MYNLASPPPDLPLFDCGYGEIVIVQANKSLLFRQEGDSTKSKTRYIKKWNSLSLPFYFSGLIGLPRSPTLRSVNVR